MKHPLIILKIKLNLKRLCKCLFSDPTWKHDLWKLKGNKKNRSATYLLKKLWILKYVLVSKTQASGWLYLKGDKHHPYCIFFKEMLSRLCVFF